MRTLHVRWAGVLALALLAGCVSEKEVNAQGRLPWNAPAAWEGQTLGVPF